MTITVYPFKFFAIFSAASYTYVRSAWPSPLLVGVPTAIKIISAFCISLSILLLKVNLPASLFFITKLSSPGSYIGIILFFKLSILSWFLSTQQTWKPNSEKQAPDTKPT